MDPAEVVAYAARAHAGLTYSRNGWDQPYVLHLARVASGVDPLYFRVAMFHDLLEDTTSPLPGVLSWEKDAIHLLTRRDDQTYSEYIEGIAVAQGIAGRAARAVKLADLRDNLAGVKWIRDKAPHLEERYTHAVLRLEDPDHE